MSAILAMSCSRDYRPPYPHPPAYLPRSSPENCLTNLRLSYNARDHDEFIKLLAPDFGFVFRPFGPRRPGDPPESWGIREEEESTYRLFEAVSVMNIELDYTPNPADSSFDEYPDTWKTVQDKITLRVQTVKPDWSDLTWLVDQEQEWFYLREYPNEKASDGKTIWRIWLWKEEILGSSKSFLSAAPSQPVGSKFIPLS
jgi:hypothetical protein